MLSKCPLQCNCKAMSKKHDFYRPSSAPKGETATLPEMSHDLRVPLARLTGLWKSKAISPIEAGEGGLKFSKSQVASLIHVAGDW